MTDWTPEADDEERLRAERLQQSLDEGVRLRLAILDSEKVLRLQNEEATKHRGEHLELLNKLVMALGESRGIVQHMDKRLCYLEMRLRGE